MTMTEFFADYYWVLWIGLILLFVIVEVTTVEFTFLMLAIGSVGGLLAGLFGGEFWLQVIVAAIVSLLLLFTVRPPLLRALKRGGDQTKTGVEALLGLAGIVVVPVVGGDPAAGPGQVKLSNGETWSARLLAPEGSGTLDTGTPVVVTAIEGSTAVVVPGTTPPSKPVSPTNQGSLS
ncbi:membrane protein implicated in regulation of membrane protease activity [Frondihabitans sp. PhB188]|uniref:NfeD family protein n=1 Tax=Frondihabitans sp. PhB188 TaxID=2485200 RepID=UPI000F4A90BA|nr:NfeD family protein [Frondihabitans sp. PhB188]ROQ40899.1 membrane protein implicated in regulation of membrane protease activity [Frondihabitans sp. PhB188]